MPSDGSRSRTNGVQFRLSVPITFAKQRPRPRAVDFDEELAVNHKNRKGMVPNIADVTGRTSTNAQPSMATWSCSDSQG